MKILALEEAVKEIFRVRHEGFIGKNASIGGDCYYGWYFYGKPRRGRLESGKLFVKLNEKLRESLEREGFVCSDDNQEVNWVEKELRTLFSVLYNNVLRDRTMREEFRKAYEKSPEQVEKEYEDKCYKLDRPRYVLLFYLVLVIFGDRASGMVSELTFDECKKDKVLLVRAFRSWEGFRKISKKMIYSMMEKLLKDYIKTYYSYGEDFDEADFNGTGTRQGEVYPMMVDYSTGGLYALGSEKKGDLVLFLSKDIVDHFRFILVKL